jgi:hypothetical protein
MTAPRLLICDALSRPDILEMFGRTVGRAEMVFVEYEYNEGTRVDPHRYAPYGEVTTWEKLASANRLLSKTRPTRVVLFYNTALNQVMLRQAALERGVEVVHLEHGIRLPAPARLPATAQVDRSRSSDWRTRMFFVRSLPRRRPRAQRRLVEYAAAITRHGAQTDLLQRFAPLRRADRYISFSEEAFAFHAEVDRVSLGDGIVELTGAPQFDDFRAVSAPEMDPTRVILIDHQLHNAGWCGWTPAHRAPWAEGISRAVQLAGLKLSVKTHPGDRSGVWDELASLGQVTLIDRSELSRLANRVRFVLGTFSTLQSPLAAMPSVAHITLEMHPDPRWFPSQRLVAAGVAEPVDSFEGLIAALGCYEAILSAQRPHKADFLRRFLYQLDGQAGERVAAALTSDRH